MTQHALQDDAPAPTQHPRRRDIHHPDRPRRADNARRTATTDAPHRRRRAVRAGVPVALAVVALSTGVATGLTQASGETRTAASTTPAASSVGRIGTGAFGTEPVSGAAAITHPTLTGASAATAGAVDATTASQAADEAAPERSKAPSGGDDALSAAQAALTRADQLTTDTRGVPRAERRSVAKSAKHLRALVADRSDAEAASRAGERTSLEVRDKDAADVAEATEALTDLLDDTDASAVSIEPAPATPAEILHAQAASARKAAPTLKKHADDTDGYENGRIPSADLAELSFAKGETLRADAAEQLERLDVAYRARFGTHLEIRDSYRSYESQVSVKASRGYFAAVPGYSDHGWGIAVDLNGGVQEYSSAQHQWLVANAGKFGWHNPAWAQADGRKPEAWHWEYSPL
ncbi:D-alanyl-D-alanine carboxypeptidase family protein [Isoptericola sp. NPDC057559]|uniref:M15 family metallopeptidase n=1 Tax=Isoptericola sp. NPDC057559 TaxID=3346168 RepID=UPI00368896B0